MYSLRLVSLCVCVGGWVMKGREGVTIFGQLSNDVAAGPQRKSPVLVPAQGPVDEARGCMIMMMVMMMTMMMTMMMMVMMTFVVVMI